LLLRAVGGARDRRAASYLERGQPQSLDRRVPYVVGQLRREADQLCAELRVREGFGHRLADEGAGDSGAVHHALRGPRAFNTARASNSTSCTSREAWDSPNAARAAASCASNAATIARTLEAWYAMMLSACSRDFAYV